MKTLTKRQIILMALAVVIASAWIFIGSRPLAVEVTTLETNVPVKVFGLGTVEARILSKVGFRLSNTIVELNADEGQFVNKGDVLARLDMVEQHIHLAMAEADLLSALAAVDGAKAVTLKAQAAVAKKARTNKRQQELFTNRTISAEAVELTKLDLDTAQAELDIARSQLAATEASLVHAHVHLDLEKVTLDQHSLRAPYDGVIVARHLELGTAVKAGDPVFTLVDPTSVWALGHISESRAGDIAPGQDAEVRLRSRPHDVFHGQVRRIDIESDRVTEERRVYVSCTDCPASFNLGEQAEVFITTTILNEVLFVPEHSVEDFNDRRMEGIVWMVESGRLKRQNVTFGHRTLDARLSILSDLPEGARVLTRLPQRAKEGRRARLKTEQGS